MRTATPVRIVERSVVKKVPYGCGRRINRGRFEWNFSTIPSAWIESDGPWFWTDDYGSTMGGVYIHTEDTL